MKVARLVAAFVIAGTVSSAATQDYASLGQTLVSQLAAGQFDKVEAQFDARMQAALPATKLASVWESLTKQAGAFRSIAGSRVAQEQPLHVVIVNCVFANASLDAQIAFNADGKVSGLYFRPGTPAAAPSSWSAPPYANRESFQERAVTIRSGTFQLPGTLTIPNGKGPFPAVVLVHGSGPLDEDETIGPNKPFKDLAWGLATRGIAVLRYVKRTKQYGAQSMHAGFTVADETVDDARAAIALLRTDPAIDAHRIFVLGHSLGGMLAPRIAEGQKVAGVVILAGSTRPMEDSVVAQLRYLASLQKSAGPEVEKQIAAAEESARRIKSPSLRADSTVDLLGAHIPGSYFLDLRQYHPGEAAAALHVPMLILQGGRDYQVTAEDLQGWQKALAKSPAVRFRQYGELTHLFMAGRAPAPPSPADYEVAGHVAAEVIADIATWVLAAPGV